MALSALLTTLSACTTTTETKSPACPVCPVVETVKIPPPLQEVSFEELPGWSDDDLSAAWNAYLNSCRSLRNKEAWKEVCAKAQSLGMPDARTTREHFETYFRPYRSSNADGSQSGLVTGYYEPLLRGSRNKRAPFLHPLYAPPDDLLIVDLGEVAPDTKNLRLRGKLVGRKIVPYASRAEIEQDSSALRGKEIVWVDDAIEAFFLQIQGSGRVQLENGGLIRVGYADQNGHPYKSIGRYLIDRGELQKGEASMQGIQAWARAHPDQLQGLLNQNPSYVFFRELPDSKEGPIGALGVPLSAERSIAVDARYVPLGAPVWLATTRPNSDVPLKRLVLAQDTGGAIRGPVRADYFWGFGAAAGEQAGRMNQQGQLWVLLPRGYPFPER